MIREEFKSQQLTTWIFKRTLKNQSEVVLAFPILLEILVKSDSAVIIRALFVLILVKAVSTNSLRTDILILCRLVFEIMEEK